MHFIGASLQVRAEVARDFERQRREMNKAAARLPPPTREHGAPGRRWTARARRGSALMGPPRDRISSSAASSRSCSAARAAWARPPRAAPPRAERRRSTACRRAPLFHYCYHCHYHLFSLRLRSVFRMSALCASLHFRVGFRRAGRTSWGPDRPQRRRWGGGCARTARSTASSETGRSRSSARSRPTMRRRARRKRTRGALLDRDGGLFPGARTRVFERGGTSLSVGALLAPQVLKAAYGEMPKLPSGNLGPDELLAQATSPPLMVVSG
jgi:hypothetical protein